MQDYLQVCMTDPGLIRGQIPIDVFSQQYCLRCIQIECTRSRMNESSMKMRAMNWKENLFNNPPRADVNDPRFSNMKTKMFSPGGESEQIYEIKKSPIETKPEEEKVVEPVQPVTEKVVEPAAAIEVKIASEEQKPTEKPAIYSKITNTPFQQGTMLNREKKDVILEPGSSYTFDSEDPVE